MHSRARPLADVFDCLASALDSFARTFTYVRDGRTSTLANILNRRTGTLSDLSDSVACTRSDVLHG